MIKSTKIDPWIAAASVFMVVVVATVLWFGSDWLRALGPTRTVSLFVLSEGGQWREGLIDEDLSPSSMVEGVVAVVAAEIYDIRVCTDELGFESFHVIIRNPLESGYQAVTQAYAGQLAAVFVDGRPIGCVRLSRSNSDRVVLSPGPEPTEEAYWRSLSTLWHRLFAGGGVADR